MDRNDIQNIIYQTIENISQKLINQTDYLYIVEGQVTEADILGNCYFFRYQNEEYVGFSITGEQYYVGDLIYVLFSKNQNIKKMILSKTKNFSNNNIRFIAKSAQETADKAAEDSKNALDKIEGVINDNRLSPSEKIMIKTDWELIKKEYELIKKDYESYGAATNPFLKPIYDEYNDNYALLKSYIEPILGDMTSPSEVNADEFLNKFNNYYISKQKVLNSISALLKDIADAAQQLAKQNEQKLKDIADDNKLTSGEKSDILKEINIIKTEMPTIISQSAQYGIPSIDYSNAYDTLITYIKPLLENMGETSDIDGAIFRQTFVNYYDEKQKLQSAISNKAKDLADDALVQAKRISINADSFAFSKPKTASEYSPEFINITAEAHVVTFEKFQYRTLAGLQFHDIVNGEHGFTLDGETLTIHRSSDLFTENNNGIIISATSNDGTINSMTTILKLSDGMDGGGGAIMSNSEPAPEDREKLWCDISVFPNIIKTWNEVTQTWVPVNEFKQGTRNWARGTAFPRIKEDEFTPIEENRQPFYQIYLPKDSSTRDKVTISFDYKVSDIVAKENETPQWIIEGEGNVTGWMSGTYPNNNQYLPLDSIGHHTYTTSLTEDMLKNEFWIMYIKCKNIISGRIEVYNYRFVLGEIESDWSLAPEDFDELNNRLDNIDYATTEIIQSQQKTAELLQETQIKTGEIDGEIVTLKNTFETFMESSPTEESITLAIQSMREAIIKEDLANIVELETYLQLVQGIGLYVGVKSSQDPTLSNVKTLMAYDHFAVLFGGQERTQIYSDRLINDNIIANNTIQIGQNVIMEKYDGGFTIEIT